MIVVKEYYYFSFEDVELRYPYSLDENKLKGSEFEKGGVWETLYEYVGENNTGCKIYVDTICVNIKMKTADLIVVTSKEYENQSDINFDEIVKILFNEELMDKKRVVLENFYEKILIQKFLDEEGYSLSSYKLPLVYTMVENCDIGVDENKRIFKWNENLKNEKNMTEGPYSAQNEKGQLITWKMYNTYNDQTEAYLYILNAYERSKDIGGGFEIDKTFMREIIDESLVRIYGKNFSRYLESLDGFNSEYIIGDKIAKWTVIPYLVARYEDYHLIQEFDSHFFYYPFDYYSEQVKVKFENAFIQNFDNGHKELRSLICSQIKYIYDQSKKSNERYKDVSEELHWKMENLDDIYFVTIAIWAIVIGILKLFWGKIKEFWKYIPKYEQKLFLTFFLVIILYIVIYDFFIIYNIIFTKNISLGGTRTYILFFSFIVAVCITTWASHNRIKRFWKWILKEKILEMALYTIISYILLHTLFLIRGFIFGNSIILLFSLILAIVYVFHRKIIRVKR